MTIKLETESLYSRFDVNSFDSLDQHIQTMAPSMVEYHLNDLSSDISDPCYINRSNIEQTIDMGEYSLYLDYASDIYLEFTQKDDGYETASFW